MQITKLQVEKFKQLKFVPIRQNLGNKSQWNRVS